MGDFAYQVVADRASAAGGGWVTMSLSVGRLECNLSVHVCAYRPRSVSSSAMCVSQVRGGRNGAIRTVDPLKRHGVDVGESE